MTLPSGGFAWGNPLMSDVRHQMQVRIVRAGADQAIDLNRAESRFLVGFELILNLSGARPGDEVVAVVP